MIIYHFSCDHNAYCERQWPLPKIRNENCPGHLFLLLLLVLTSLCIYQNQFSSDGNSTPCDTQYSIQFEISTKFLLLIWMSLVFGVNFWTLIEWKPMKENTSTKFFFFQRPDKWCVLSVRKYMVYDKSRCLKLTKFVWLVWHFYLREETRRKKNEKKPKTDK